MIYIYLRTYCLLVVTFTVLSFVNTQAKTRGGETRKIIKWINKNLYSRKITVGLLWIRSNVGFVYSRFGVGCGEWRSNELLCDVVISTEWYQHSIIEGSRYCVAILSVQGKLLTYTVRSHSAQAIAFPYNILTV